MGIITDKLASFAPIVIETIIDALRPRMDLEEIAEDASPAIDKLIGKYKNEGMKFVGGKFKIILVKPNGFAVGYELFFQDAKADWHKADNLSKKMDAKYHLTEDARNILNMKTIVTYDIEDPDTAIKNMQQDSAEIGG